MACRNGNSNVESTTKLRLFADSAGYCQNPNCQTTLFVDIADQTVHFAELAHIIAKSIQGPRGKSNSDITVNGSENLILLCPTCHTIVDKSEETYPIDLLLLWKRQHTTEISRLFGATKYDDRASLRTAIEPTLYENHSIHVCYGPENEYRENPESEIATVWRRKVLSKILPNNNRLLRILDGNRHLLSNAEMNTVEIFRQHVDDLTLRHFAYDSPEWVVGARFPEKLNDILLQSKT